MAFDAGTGAGRCSIFDTSGHLIVSAYREWEYDIPADTDSQGRSFSPEGFWNIFCSLCKDVLHRSGVNSADIVGLSTTSQREGMVFLDRNGIEIYAGPNIDNRGYTEYQAFSDYQHQLREITGLGLFTLLGPARLLWFKNTQPDVYERIDCVLMISDWLAYRLCGETASEPTIASSSQFLDIQKRNWSDRVTKIFSIRDDIFPPIFSAGTQLGAVTKKAAQETGLKQGTIVAVGGGDTHMGLLGINITDETCISAIAGTSTPVMATIDRPFIDPDQRVSTSCYILPDRWTLESNAGMTGMPYRWVRDTFADDYVKESQLTGEDPYHLINCRAAEVSPGADGWMAFIGAGKAGVNHYSMGGFFFPLDWTLDHFDRRHLYRSAIETMAYGIRINFDQLIEITKSTQPELKIGGGQTKSKLFNEILTNSMNLPIHVFQVKEATSLGAAICAAVGSKVYGSLEEAAENMVHIESLYEPDQKIADLYNQAYQKWKAFGKYLNKFSEE
jgi:autoinducer 2 (AI-2) kinase